MSKLAPPRFAAMRGFTLLETLAVLAIAAMLLVGLTSLINTAYGNARAQQAALYQSQVSNAALRLIQENYQALLTAAMSTGNPLVVSLTASNPAGYKLGAYLPASMQALNAYQQQPCLLIYRGTGAGWTSGTGLKDIVAFVVTEGGQTIDDRTLGNIEANAGAGAGAIQAMGGGVAQGAFGSWSAPLTTINPTGASCSGAATSAGHLVSQVYYTGSDGASGDFLYRQPVSVTGVADGNTMHAPILLSDLHTDRASDAACDATTDSSGNYVDLGKLTADAAGNVLTCANTGSGVMWAELGSMHWSAPVQDYADLTNLAALASSNPSLLQAGDVRLVTSLARAFAWTGAQWQALAVDQNGNLSVPGLLNLGNQSGALAGTACSNVASETSVSTDANGIVYSCQNGVWRSSSAVTGWYQDVNCVDNVVMPGATDFPCGVATPATSYYPGNGYWYSVVTRSLSALPQNGKMDVYAWAHFRTTEVAACPSAPSDVGGGGGYVVMDVWILDNDKPRGVVSPPDTPANFVMHAVNQSSRVTADLANINVTLAQPLPVNKNGYSVEIWTAWAIYGAPDGTAYGGGSYTLNGSYPTSFCGGSTYIPATPIATNWSITATY